MTANHVFKNNDIMTESALPGEGHKYQSLNLSTDEFRLLVLHPGEYTQGINCSLIHHSLGHHKDYEALSYTWGDDASPRTIMLDGLCFQVNKNLDIALRHLRRLPHSGERVLWIDALCINQENSEERSHQVRQMYKIYSSASRVVAWLGQAEGGSDMAMDFVADINKGKGLFDSYERPVSPPERWVALNKFWARPYWGRVWIIQELAATFQGVRAFSENRPRAIIVCGNKSLSLHIFENAWHYLNRYINNPLVHGNGEYLPARNLFSILFDHTHKRLTLGRLISLTSTANATDPRDHFFAVLGLAPTSRPNLSPNYAKTFKEVCGQYMEHIIRADGKLDVLTHGNFGGNTNIPSWAPDFTGTLRNDVTSWSIYRQNFRASGKGVQNSPHIRFSNEFRSVIIKGASVDSVATVEHLSTGDFNECFSVLVNTGILKKPMQETIQTRYAEDPLITIGRTFALDHHRQSNPPIVKLGVHIPNGILKALRQIEDEFIELGEDEMDESEITSYQKNVLINYFALSTPDVLRGRCFFTTSLGYIGIGPRGICSGDKIAILLGGNMPFVIRGDSPSSRFVGEAYVHGIMQGEFMNSSATIEKFQVE
jgi:hypothetical protein